MPSVDLKTTDKREFNRQLHALPPNTNETLWRVENPNGQHSLAVGLDAPITVEIGGHAGYYCAGMNKQATIIVEGNVGVGVAENMISGMVHVKGDASQAAGATAHGGLLIIDGDASARCGISMKGINIVVKGSIGPMSAFMAQSGMLVVLGDAGDALGDSIYEAMLFVRGSVKSLGTDCVEKTLRDEHKQQLRELLKSAGLGDEIDVNEFKRYGSSRKLYNFHVDNVAAY